MSLSYLVTSIRCLLELIQCDTRTQRNARPVEIAQNRFDYSAVLTADGGESPAEVYH